MLVDNHRWRFVKKKPYVAPKIFYCCYSRNLDRQITSASPRVGFRRQDSREAQPRKYRQGSFFIFISTWGLCNNVLFPSKGIPLSCKPRSICMDLGTRPYGHSIFFPPLVETIILILIFFFFDSSTCPREMVNCSPNFLKTYLLSTCPE